MPVNIGIPVADRWVESLSALTPVHLGADGFRYYKREDCFAPLGYGSINGSKLRQLIWLIARAERAGAEGILTGASVLSPQVSMTALVARHFGLRCVVVLGGTGPASCFKHENVAIAAQAGAEFLFVPVGYNPTLQRSVSRMLDEPEFAGWARVHYGITTGADADDAEIEAFHSVGALQAQNIPDDVERLVMTCGSGNSCTSVLYGLAKWRAGQVRRVRLIGVGPSKWEWAQDRLAAIERVTGIDALADVEVEYEDLHAAKWATYADRMPETLDGISFHPTYEGKAIRWLRENDWPPERGDLFWIVGSEPRRRR